MNQRKDPQNDMIENFEAGPLPPPGMPSMTRPPPLPPAPPRLCELGPCRHYHAVDIVLDSQQPIDGSPGRVDIKTHRSCYAQIGVDTDITDVPVVRCSKWDPMGEDDADEIRRARRQRDALRSEEGAEYTRKYGAWEREVAVRNGEALPPPAPDDASPLVRIMRDLNHGLPLPEHKPGGAICDDDCPRCSLHRLAMEERLLEEEHENDPELGMPHYVTYRHVIAILQDIRVVKTLGYTEDGAEYIVAAMPVPDKYKDLAIGTEMTELADNDFAPKERT